MRTLVVAGLMIGSTQVLAQATVDAQGPCVKYAKGADGKLDQTKYQNCQSFYYQSCQKYLDDANTDCAPGGTKDASIDNAYYETSQTVEAKKAGYASAEDGVAACDANLPARRGQSRYCQNETDKCVGEKSKSDSNLKCNMFTVRGQTDKPGQSLCNLLEDRAGVISEKLAHEKSECAKTVTIQENATDRKPASDVTETNSF